MQQSHTVMVILEAKQGQEQALKHALQTVAKHSAQEGSNLEYRIHQAKDHPEQFVMYERWESQASHALQFEKDYIKAFAEEVETLLAKPYEVYMADEVFY